MPDRDENGDDDEGDAYYFSLNDRSAGPNASNNTIKGMQCPASEFIE